MPVGDRLIYLDTGRPAEDPRQMGPSICQIVHSIDPYWRECSKGSLVSNQKTAGLRPAFEELQLNITYWRKDGVTVYKISEL